MREPQRQRAKRRMLWEGAYINLGTVLAPTTSQHFLQNSLQTCSLQQCPGIPELSSPVCTREDLSSVLIELVNMILGVPVMIIAARIDTFIKEGTVDHVLARDEHQCSIWNTKDSLVLFAEHTKHNFPGTFWSGRVQCRT